MALFMHNANLRKEAKYLKDLLFRRAILCENWIHKINFLPIYLKLYHEHSDFYDIGTPEYELTVFFHHKYFPPIEREKYCKAFSCLYIHNFYKDKFKIISFLKNNKRSKQIGRAHV